MPEPTDIIARYAARVGYSAEEQAAFAAEGHRIRQVEHLARAARKYSIEVEIVASEHCNSGHQVGQKLVLDCDGNFITKYCPKRICVYLAAQLTTPVALINERLSEGLAPDDFHFCRQVSCPDVGVHHLGYGRVRAAVRVVPRVTSRASPE